MEKEKILVWVSKFALTKGIYQVEGEMRSQGIFNFGGPYDKLHKGEWHLEKEQAITKAEQMRNKKIASLKKQIEKLEKMKF